MDQWNLIKPKPIEVQNQIKRKPRSNGATRQIFEIPEWLQEVRDILFGG